MNILNLREAQQFVPIVADRLWQAWWRDNGSALADVEQALGEVLAAPAFPFTLVATVDDRFAGTVTAIASDMDDRPQYSPWIAALWVEPERRGSGIAQALVQQALQTLFDQGNSAVYLCAEPGLRRFYLADSWQLLEERAGTAELDIFVRRQLA